MVSHRWLTSQCDSAIHLTYLWLTIQQLISDIKVIPGLADHDAVTIEGDISPIVNKQKPSKIHLYKKADWDGFKEFKKRLQRWNLWSHTSFWGRKWQWKWCWITLASFKSQLHLGINKFIPSKIAKKKHLYPWIDADLRRLIRERNRYFKIKNNEQSKRYQPL